MTTQNRNAEPGYGIQLAFAASEAELPSARQQSHDKLIEDLGDRRLSGVTWVEYDVPDGVRVMRENGYPFDAGVEQWLADYPDGLIVIAMAEASAP